MLCYMSERSLWQTTDASHEESFHDVRCPWTRRSAGGKYARVVELASFVVRVSDFIEVERCEQAIQ